MNGLAAALLLLTLEGDWPAEQRRVTLEFDRAPAVEVLRATAEASGLSIVIPNVHGARRVTVAFRDTPVADALRTVLEAAGLRAERRGTLITVYDRDDDGEEDAEGAKGSDGRHARGRPRDGSPPERIRIGGGVVIEAGEEVSEAVAVGGDVEVRGRAREVVAVGGDVRVLDSGEVSGEAVAVGGKVHVAPGARVGGDRVEIGPRALARLVSGALGLGAAASVVWWLVHGVASFVVFFVVGWILLALAPRRLDTVGGTLFARPYRSGLVGLLGAVVGALLCCLLVVSILGIPLLPLLALGIAAAIVLGMAALALRLGRALPIGRHKGELLSLGLGTLVLVVLRHLPWVGGAVVWVATLFAFGAVILSRGGAPSEPGLPPAPEPTPAV
jgi:uncharacterized protein YqgC (DUF456 family)